MAIQNLGVKVCFSVIQETDICQDNLNFCICLQYINKKKEGV